MRKESAYIQSKRNAEYLEPLGYVAITTMVVFFILIVTAFRKISQWSRNEELQESIVTR